MSLTDQIFGSVGLADDIQFLTTRVRRLERGDPYLRRGSFVPTNADFRRGDIGIYNSQAGISTNAGISTPGSVAPTQNTSGFSYVADGTSITIYWDGTNSSKLIVVQRADRTTYVLPAGHLAVTGLANTTAYGFLPYSPTKFMTNNGAIPVNVGWVLGLHGSPKIAFTATASTGEIFNSTGNYMIQQCYQDREPLTSTWLLATTTAGAVNPPTPPDPGGGGVPGDCVMEGTKIEEFMGHPVSMIGMHNQRWMGIKTKNRTLYCTYDHPLYCPSKGKRPVRLLKPCDWVITKDGEEKIIEKWPFEKYGNLIKSEVPTCGLFWANGFLSHNNKTFPPTV